MYTIRNIDPVRVYKRDNNSNVDLVGSSRDVFG